MILVYLKLNLNTEKWNQWVDNLCSDYNATYVQCLSWHVISFNILGDS